MGGVSGAGFEAGGGSTAVGGRATSGTERTAAFEAPEACVAFCVAARVARGSSSEGSESISV